ncbi:hypothetical protein Nepgr_028168 [Nepenthes gracilis]|uniref:Uncharacterized protein n=1 Tax=Nepenthes gracilis TaxID=150966 RepID=A0AAD3Y3P2_NEPGR|nr:hypothetical protein Nepgr_028168 [Nepenthes gracilis]
MAMENQEHSVDRETVSPSPQIVPTPVVLIAGINNLQLLQSPGTPSPEDASQMRILLRRLEEINAESRQLLEQLFRLLEKDMRLEKYIRRRLDDPSVSHMWELVERILAHNQGPVNLDELMRTGSDDAVHKGIVSDDDRDKEDRLEKFKIRTLIVDEEDRLEKFKIRTLIVDEEDTKIEIPKNYGK